ncbi:MAG: ECF-type sigma factor [Acidobacteriota bacterium]
MDSDDATTRWLSRWNAGDPAAASVVVDRVYDELHRLAISFFRQERRGHTLQPTAILNESLAKLFEKERHHWHSREHFIGFVARAMRHVLVDHARAKRSAKRDPGGARLSLSEAAEAEVGAAAGSEPGVDLLALSEVLDRLDKVDPEKVRIVELRSFAGLTIAECAEYLEISPTRVVRQWRRARAWLLSELTPVADGI